MCSLPTRPLGRRAVTFQCDEELLSLKYHIPTYICILCTVVPGGNNMLDFWIFILLHFVITLEAPLDVEQAAACGSPGEEDGPPRTGNSIDSQGRLMLWGI